MASKRPHKDRSSHSPKYAKGQYVDLKVTVKGFQTAFDFTIENTRTGSDGKPEYSLQRYNGAPYAGGMYFKEADLETAAGMTPQHFREEERTHGTQTGPTVQYRESHWEESDSKSMKALDSNKLFHPLYEGDVETVREILDNGFDLNITPDHQVRALGLACSRGHVAVVKLLLERGADVNAQAEFHSSALQAASACEHEAVVKLLLERGADVNAQGGFYDRALTAASSRGHESVVRQLLEAGADINARGEFYGSALQAASKQKHEAVIRQLLEAGADVNAHSFHHRSALNKASANGREAVVQLLLSRGKPSISPPASLYSAMPSTDSGYGSGPSVSLSAKTLNIQRIGSQVHCETLQEEDEHLENTSHMADASSMGDADDKSSALGAFPNDDVQNGNEQDTGLPMDSFTQNSESWCQSVDILRRQVFQCGSEALGEIELRNGFDFLPLPTVSGPGHRRDSDSAQDELGALLERNLAMMSAILKGINVLTEEHICDSTYNVIVVDPKRENVLRVITVTVPNLELLRDLLDEAMSCFTAPVPLLMEVISDIGAATVQILDYLGLWTSSLQPSTANTHRECIDQCRSLSSLCTVLFLGLISFIKSHLIDTDVTHQDLYKLQIETVHQTVSMAPRRLACLDSFLRQSVWTFSIVPETPHSSTASVERYYLSTLLGDFANLWGPLRLAYLDPKQGLVAEIGVRGGVIWRSDYSPETPRAQGDEVLCHFYDQTHEDINRDVDPTFSIPSTNRLLIGASNNSKARNQENPFKVHEKCNCQPGSRYSLRHDMFDLGTEPPSWKSKTRTRQIGGGQYVIMSVSEGRELNPGTRLRDTILEHWCDRNPTTTSLKFQLSEPCYLDYLVVLEISQCTGHTQRTSLWTILRSSTVRQFVGTRLGERFERGLHDLLLREEGQKEMLRSKEPRSFVDVWKDLSDDEKVRMREIMGLILQCLRSTGVQQDSLIAWDIAFNVRGTDGRKITPSWRSMIKDDIQCATFAIITDRCIQYETLDRWSSHFESRTILSTQVCITTDHKLKINERHIGTRAAGHILTVHQHHVTTLRPPTDPISHRNTSIIMKRLEQSELDLSPLRERYERRKKASSRSIVNTEPVLSPCYPTSTHGQSRRQSNSGSSTYDSPHSSRLTRDSQSSASSVTADNFGKDLWCNVSLRLRNGTGTLNLDPSNHTTAENMINKVGEFNLSATSGAGFIPAKWKEGTSQVNAYHDRKEALGEKLSPWVQSKLTWWPWKLDEMESEKDGRVDVVEHVRGGVLAENQKVINVHVR